MDKEPNKIFDTLIEYEKEISEFEEHIRIIGKTLEHANRENPSWQLYYDQKRIELNILVKYCEMKIASVRGQLFKSYTDSFQRELSDRAKDKYIDAEPQYLNWVKILLAVKEIHDKYLSVCNAFQTRGYSLNNITKARTTGLEDVII
jgi:hypothetical protein